MPNVRNTKRLGLATSLLVALGFVALKPSCVHRTFSLTMDGYRLDRSGERRERGSEGVFSAALAALSIENRHGRVSVEAAEKDQPASWEWSVAVWGERAEVAESLLAEVELISEESGNRGILTLKLPEARKSELRGLESNITVRLPATVAVKVRNRFGPTAVRGLKAGTRVEAAHGAVTAQDLAGEIHLETSFAPLTAALIQTATVRNAHGEVRIEGVDGDLDARTSFALLKAHEVRGQLLARNQHGEIKAEHVGGSVDLETSFASLFVADVAGDAKLIVEHGNIHGAELHGITTARNSFGDISLESDGPELTCRNQHGEVAIELSRADFQHVKADTSFGSIRVALPPGVEPAIAARASFGRVRSPLPYLERPAATTAGKPSLELAVEHGNIRISQD